LASVQAAALTAKLELMMEWQKRREQIAAIFEVRLAQAPHARRMLTLAGNQHNFHKYVLWAENRKALKDGLAAAGVQTKTHYDIPLHRQPLFSAYAGLAFCPSAEAAAEHVLSLPMYPELTDEEAEYIAERARAVLEAIG
jgi:dTDP-4-amino-4,6-dideoxygalactose transaminase